MCAVCCGKSERLTCKEINCHGAENGSIDVRPVAERLHSGELNHHLQPGVSLSGQPSLGCDFGSACVISNLYPPPRLNMVPTLQY